MALLNLLKRTAMSRPAIMALMALGTSSLVHTSTAAAGSTKPPVAMQEFGKTLPPIGFVKFCASQPAACAQSNGDKIKPLVMSPSRWQLVAEINAYVNGKIAPVSDQDLYGQAEYWAYPVDAGDCEDYVLLKQRYLERLGLPESALLVTVVLDEKKEGHAVLTLSTSEGDYVLDNRQNDVKKWTDTNYTYLKRQSHQSRRQWVALIAGKSKQKSAELLTSK